MDPYHILKVLQDSGQFDKLRAEIFAHPSIQSQFKTIQQRLITELSCSPLLLDVPLKMRQSRLPQIFNSFRLAVRKTSVANDIHSILWTVIHEMVPQIYSAIECATIQPPLQTCPEIDPGQQTDIKPGDNADPHSETNKQQTQSTVFEPANSEQIDAISPIEDQVPTLGAVNDAEPLTRESENIKTDQDYAYEPEKRVKSSKGKKRGRLVRLDSKATDKDGSGSTSDDDYIPAQKKSSESIFTSPQEPISRRVEIWWPLDRCWYKGTVTAFRARDKKHHIRYDDNEIEWLDLLKERWKYE